MTAQTEEIKKRIDCAKEGVSEEFGLLFKKYRKKNGYTLKQLESMAHVDHTYINRIENGTRSQISFSKAIRLAFSLGIPYETLISTVIDGYKLEGINITLDEIIKQESHNNISEEDKKDIFELIEFIINCKWESDTKVRELYMLSEKIDYLKSNK